jgi:L-alanine-DL-glutamate epimerase-like enolase superfamily enzyme
LGIWNGRNYPALRDTVPVKIAGGEIVTTPQEMTDRIEMDWYDIAQPDATVIGGISAVLSVFKAAERNNIEVLVHCWGGPVGMMANYHTAIAGGGTMAEWPMPRYPLRDALLEHPWQIENGLLHLPESPGLGLQLTPEIEEKYKFREDGVYNCLASAFNVPPDEVWAI